MESGSPKLKPDREILEIVVLADHAVEGLVVEAESLLAPRERLVVERLLRRVALAARVDRDSDDGGALGYALFVVGDAFHLSCSARFSRRGPTCGDGSRR